MGGKKCPPTAVLGMEKQNGLTGSQKVFVKHRPRENKEKISTTRCPVPLEGFFPHMSLGGREVVGRPKKTQTPQGEKRCIKPKGGFKTSFDLKSE